MSIVYRQYIQSTKPYFAPKPKYKRKSDRNYSSNGQLCCLVYFSLLSIPHSSSKKTKTIDN